MIGDDEGRPEALADVLQYFPPAGDGWQAAAMAQIQALWSGAKACRVTQVDLANPLSPYPDGLYFEGWTVAPQTMDPPHKAGAFGFPAP